MKINSLIKKLLQEIITFIILALDSFVFKIPTKEKRFYDICCIKVDALGDFILWLDSSFSISNAYKDKSKILICNQINYELAKNLNHFDKIYPIDIYKFKRNLKYRFNCLKRFNSLNIKLVMHPTFSREILIGDSIIRAINSKNKIGFVGDFKNQDFLLKQISDNWYSQLIQIEDLEMHELEINKKFLHSQDIKIKSNFKLKKLVDLERFKFDFKNQYILINPGASNHERALPAEKYSNLINFILKRFKYFVILTGSKTDKLITNSILKSISNERLLDLTGQTSVPELIEIIRSANFVISNDSASVHIAYAVKTKAICISSGNNFSRFVPYSKNNKSEYKPYTFYSENCLKNKWRCSKYHRCIDEVNIDQIKNQISNLIYDF